MIHFGRPERPSGVESGLRLRHPEVFVDLRRIRDISWIDDLVLRMEARHEETYTHSQRVSLLALDLAHENGIVLPGVLDKVGAAAILHDLGKLYVPPDVLDKPGFLSESEQDLIEEHPRTGYDRVRQFSNVIARIIVQHHEWKPHPYPRSRVERRQLQRDVPDRRATSGLVAKLSQIVAVADMFDAMAHGRSYQDELGAGEIERILRDQYLGDQRFVDQILSRTPLDLFPDF